MLHGARDRPTGEVAQANAIALSLAVQQCAYCTRNLYLLIKQSMRRRSCIGQGCCLPSLACLVWRTGAMFRFRSNAINSLIICLPSRSRLKTDSFNYLTYTCNSIHKLAFVLFYLLSLTTPNHSVMENDTCKQQ
jgi:hypothetical protein